MGRGLAVGLDGGPGLFLTPAPTGLSAQPTGGSVAFPTPGPAVLPQATGITLIGVDPAAAAALQAQHTALQHAHADWVAQQRAADEQRARMDASEAWLRAQEQTAGAFERDQLRAQLAELQTQEVNLLVLDEPTNHLDLEAVEQLEQALAAYDGSLVVVSHDRRFLEGIAPDREVALP